MSRVFADTSFYVALVNPKDTWHHAAADSGELYHGLVVTTEYILLELGNHLCCSDSDRRLFLELIDALRADAETTIVPASPELFEEGLRLFASRPDKQWSLTDCISLCVMKRRGIVDALACDHHFEQAGFHLLLKQ